MIETNGAVATRGPKLDVEFERAVRNSMMHARRSLLDFLDFQRTQLPDAQRRDERVGWVFEFLKRRVHNDVSIISDQVLAAFRIYQAGGEIPPFGRTAAEIERATGRPEEERCRPQPGS
jgi:hypothetical protein